MAKGQHLSPYQMGIVKRFYEHRSTVLVGRLAELVSDLYVAGDEKTRERLWKAARDTLRKAGVDEADAQSIYAERRLQDLAGVVAGLQASPAPRSQGPRATPASRGKPGAETDDL
ncbi:MAG: hypothetical protein SFY69_09820 [Planctomycetota bacterium]|nr:hypothetical protein [Planctomycetota bacterium]